MIQFTGATTFDVITRTDLLDGGGTTPIVAGATFTAGTPIDLDVIAAPPLGFELSINGTPAAGDVFYTNTTEKQSIMTTISNLAEGLNTLSDAPADRAELEALIADALDNIGFAEDHISQVKAEIGARQNTLESVRVLHEGVELVNAEILSEIRDLDYAEAISRLSLETFTLETAQQSFAKVSNLPLFNFLR